MGHCLDLVKSSEAGGLQPAKKVVMGDFIIDFRKQGERDLCFAKSVLKYYDDIQIFEHVCDSFSIVLTLTDDTRLWGPFFSNDEKVFAALVGRIALSDSEWQRARSIQGVGGVASKALVKLYKENQDAFAQKLNGSFTAILHDKSKKRLFIVTDRCGMSPCFGIRDSNRNYMGISSHASALAHSFKVSGELDEISISEFIVTGKLTPPNTYYKQISSLDYGCLYEFRLNGHQPHLIRESKYFDFNFNVDHELTEWDLAEELALAFRKALSKRTLPMFGKTGVSLSAGLDSRAMLCSIGNRKNSCAFCFFDSMNLEFDISQRIAEKANVEFIEIQRGFEHYGDTAAAGVMISGAFGDFGSNHYLGFRSIFRHHGLDNLITGFYCDYLFKGLVLNTKICKILRIERLSDFNYVTYMPFFWQKIRYRKDVLERLQSLFPEDVQSNRTRLNYLMAECRRIFPLCYEPDNMETVIPQKVMGWYLPITDNGIIDVYLRTPPEYKLNTSMYSKAVQLICGKEISKITNINTGTHVNAPYLKVLVRRNLTALRRSVSRRKGKMASDESWPNWGYYLVQSAKIKSLWNRENTYASAVLEHICREDVLKKSISEFREKGELKLFLRLLTMKIWLSQN